MIQLVRMSKNPKRPRDANQLAKSVVDIASGDRSDDADKDEGKDLEAAALGRKGGKARAEKLTPEQRSEIAKTAAAARWKKS